jgi:hypothetical protein
MKSASMIDSDRDRNLVALAMRKTLVIGLLIGGIAVVVAIVIAVFAGGRSGWVALVPAVIGAALVARVLLSNQRVAIVRDRPADIVWIFAEQIESRPSRFTEGTPFDPDSDAAVQPGPMVNYTYSVNVYCADGRGWSLVVARDDVKPLLDALARLAPRAARGFTKELERTYRDDPRSLVS